MDDDELLAMLHVPGLAQPKQRARSTRRGRHYTPAATIAAQDRIAAAFRAVAPGHVPDKGPYRVHVHVVMPSRRRADVDNLAKVVLDGLNEVAWTDDRYVTVLHVRRSLGNAATAGTYVAIFRSTEEVTS